MFKFIFPPIIESVYLYTVAGWEVYLPEILIAVGILAIFGFFNIKGSGLSGRLQFILDRKSTRLNSSHVAISYAVFCLKKKKKTTAELTKQVAHKEQQ